MSGKSHISTFFLTTTSFIGGVAVGFLLNHDKKEKERGWVSDWLDNRSAVILEKGNKSINTVRRSINKEIENNIPDPYKATENIPLKDSKILGI